MTIAFQPKIQSVLICDFTGYVVPEMVKRRPVVAIARSRTNKKLVTVVPMSTTKPVPQLDVHHQLSVNPIPKNATVPVWAKCDMVATLSIDWLDRYHTRERGNPKRVYHELIVPDVDFEAIREAVRRALHLK